MLFRSIHGTNTIEGGRLNLEETGAVLRIAPALIKEEEGRRVANIKVAYDLAQEKANRPDWLPDATFACQLHAAVTQGLTSVDARNQPGILRDNPKGFTTYVGSTDTGGRYKPPQSGRDIARLLEELMAWHAGLAAQGVPALVRAPLLHLYFELVHPFWDGNGRVGRALEASVLLAAGYRYAPFALARYYLEEIHQYFGLFNACRKNAAEKLPAANQPFVRFHLEGMLITVKRLHDRVNRMVETLLFETRLKRMADGGEINARQYAIASQLLHLARPHTLDELRQMPWFQALYLKRSDKTRQRDLADCRSKGLLQMDEAGNIRPGFVAR